MFFRRLVMQMREVVLIHRDDVIEAFEIFARNTACIDVVQAHATAFGSSSRPSIGWFPGVIGMRTGGIDAEPLDHACLFGVVAKNTLCRRRPTDIAHADKQDTRGLRHFANSTAARFKSSSVSTPAPGRSDGIPTAIVMPSDNARSCSSCSHTSSSDGFAATNCRNTPQRYA